MKTLIYASMIVAVFLSSTALAVESGPGPSQTTPDLATTLAHELVKSATSDLQATSAAAGAIASPQTAISWPQIAEKYGDQVADAIKGLAGKAEDLLTKASPTIWKVLVSKQYAEAGMDLAPAAAFLLVLLMWSPIVLFSRETFGHKLKEADGTLRDVPWYIIGVEDDDWLFVVKWFIPLLLLIGFMISISVGAYYAAPRLVAPEWYAIQDIIDAATKLLHGQTIMTTTTTVVR